MYQENIPSDRTGLRKYQRARRKARLKVIQRSMGLPKCLVQHARRHGEDAETIQLQYLKYPV